MKKLVIICMGLLAAASLFADGQRKVRPRGMSKPSGGIVEKAYRGKVIRIANAQNAIPAKLVSDIAYQARLNSQLPIEVKDGIPEREECPISMASKLLAEENVGAAIVVVDDEKLPFILSSPDMRCAVLNVNGIKSVPERQEVRFKKLLWHALARALGAGSTGDRGCVLYPFTNVKELDSIMGLAPSPMAHNSLIEVAYTAGIRILTFATYRTACKQGWASEPQNEEQRAIWDEIHTIPANPMKIEFDPKKGR